MASMIGTRIITATVDVTIPPTIGAAIGFITSEPNARLPEQGREARDNGEDRHEHRPQAQHRPIDGRRPDVLVRHRSILGQTLIERRAQIS